MRKINAVYKPYWDHPGRYKLLFGGAGSSKSVTAAQKHISLAAQSDKVRVLTLRKIARTCRHSTFALYRDILRSMGRLDQVSINRQEMRIGFPGGGDIMHAGLDDVQKLKSITGVTHIWVEEATELDFPTREHEEPDLAQIDLRLRGVDPELKPSITMTFNPTPAAEDIFRYVGVSEAQLPERDHATYDDGEVYIQHSTYEDNPWLGEGYLSVFRKLGGSMQTIYEQGKLARIDEPDQLIPYSYVKQARDLEPKEGLGYMAIDVARFGDDDTVFAHKEGTATYELEVHSGLSTDRTATVAASRIDDRGISAERVGVDAIGVGAGVVDNLRRIGYDVVSIVSGAEPAEYQDARDREVQFKNLRSQMWWVMRERLRKGQVALTVDSSRLIEELCAPRYSIAAEKTVEVEKKSDTKGRLGRSPDEADAAVYVEALTTLQIEQRTTVWAR